MASITIDPEDYLIVHYLQEEGDYSKILYINKMKERLEAEIELLKAENARLKEALEFYADRNNWKFPSYQNDCKDMIDFNDVGCKSYNEEADFACGSGGRRAREALKGGE